MTQRMPRDPIFGCSTRGPKFTKRKPAVRAAWTAEQKLQLRIEYSNRLDQIERHISKAIRIRNLDAVADKARERNEIIKLMSDKGIKRL